ncbi:RDD family protein [Spirillospora sp. CA-294931]|uniref:RDD family protein n=1 Tax=Spirillospora sp. CA-294931 TaxID=3240042 RepID=UPI003D92E321
MADPGQRLLARIVDTLIVGLPVVLVVREALPRPDAELVIPPVVAGLLLLYESLQLALWGRTLGKRFAGIHVVPRAQKGAANGEPVASPPISGEGGSSRDLGRIAQIGRAVRFAAGGREGSSTDDDEPASAGEIEVDAEVTRLGIGRALLRAATYALPIAARPVPVLGLIAGVFWVVNAAALYEGPGRRALHDRAAGTIVVKRPTL